MINLSELEITDEEFNQFRKMIYESAGIHLSDAKKKMVASRLMKRLRYYSLPNYTAYLAILQNPENNAEHQIFINEITTNETYFFREEKHFEILKEKILPKFKNVQNLMVWSAAASTGEEAYTIAMELSENRPDGKWEIIGTDINEKVIQTAMNGVYPLEDTSKIPSLYLKKYCLKGVGSQAGFFTFKESLKKKVNFMTANLKTPFNWNKKFHIVFLRNVLIYFDMETKKQIIRNILNQMDAGGHLIVGHSENLRNLSDQIISLEATIYVKK